MARIDDDGQPVEARVADPERAERGGWIDLKVEAVDRVVLVVRTAHLVEECEGGGGVFSRPDVENAGELGEVIGHDRLLE